MKFLKILIKDIYFFVKYLIFCLNILQKTKKKTTISTLVIVLLFAELCIIPLSVCVYWSSSLSTCCCNCYCCCWFIDILLLLLLVFTSVSKASQWQQTDAADAAWRKMIYKLHNQHCKYQHTHTSLPIKKEKKKWGTHTHTLSHRHSHRYTLFLFVGIPANAFLLITCKNQIKTPSN